MSAITRSVEELVDANPDVDNRATFEALWTITGEMFAKVQRRFALTKDPCCADLEAYAGKNGSGGYLAAYAGPEIDWLIHSWTGNPAASFTNMHLTINLGPQVDVPNFGFALGTIPDLFWYMDLMPRRELVTDADYAEKYWGGATNEAFLGLQRTEGLQPFVSRDTYTRVALSPSAACFSAKPTPANIDVIRAASHAHLDRWLAWVDAAVPVAQSKRAALARRDEKIRRTVCERDPANIVAEKLFGKPMTDRLVATLWGGTRTLPRPT